MGIEKYFTRAIKEDPRYFYFEIPREPPSTNHLWLANYRGGRRLSKAAQEFYTIARAVVMGKQLPEDWESCVVSISIIPRRRGGDIDNRIKAVLDALTKALFWQDDRIVSEVSCRFEAPRGISGDMTRVLIKRGGEKYPKLEGDK